MTEEPPLQTPAGRHFVEGVLKLRNFISLIFAALVYLGLYQYVGGMWDTGRAALMNVIATAAVAFSVSVGTPPRDSWFTAISAFIGIFSMSMILLMVIPAMQGQEPGNLLGIAVMLVAGYFAIPTYVGWCVAQPRAFGRWVKANW